MESKIIRYGAMLIAAILFVMFVYLVLAGKETGQYVSVAVMFVFAVLATRLDDITNLKFGATGVAAGLEKKLREAQATVEQLQGIAEVFARLSLHQIAASNRLVGMKPQQKREALEKIQTALKSLSLSEKRITDTMSVYFPYEDFDYYHWTMSAIFRGASNTVIEARKEFKEKFPDNGIGSNPSPEEVEAFLKEKGWYRGEFIERLKDWKQYRRKRTYRRLELFEARHDEQPQSLEDWLK